MRVAHCGSTKTKAIKNVAGLFQQNRYTPGMNLFRKGILKIVNNIIGPGAISIAAAKSCVTAAVKLKNGGDLVIVQMLLGGC